MSDLGRTGRTFWGAAITVVVLDVITKYVAEHNLTLHVPQRAIGNVVRWTLAYNPGAAFSMSLGPASRQPTQSLSAMLANLAPSPWSPLIVRCLRAWRPQSGVHVTAIDAAIDAAIERINP